MAQPPSLDIPAGDGLLSAPYVVRIYKLFCACIAMEIGHAPVSDMDCCQRHLWPEFTSCSGPADMFRYVLLDGLLSAPSVARIYKLFCA
jgi:hypothetical protein